MFQFKQARPFLAIIAVHLSILPPASNAADNLGILGARPRWNALEKYQETITHDEFARLINNVYCTHGFAPDLITIDEKDARILTNRNAQKFFILRIAVRQNPRSEEHTSELQSLAYLVCRLLLEKKKNNIKHSN